MRKINYIVVHCSATREGCTLTSEALEAEHRRRGFRTTGYHYYIRRDGTVLGTRSLELPGAHCRGHNKYSIGICYEGGWMPGEIRRIPVRRSSIRPCTCWCTSCYNSSGTPVYAATATSAPIWTEMGRWSRGSG